MQKKITISFEVPIHDDMTDSSSIYFNRWIPKEPTVVTKNNLTLKLWIDKECIPFLKNDEEISPWVNISVNKIKIEIETNIENELANFIYNERDSWKNIHYGLHPNNQEYQNLSIAFKELGFDFVNFTIDIINRLISYVRNYNNQYWLEPISYEKNNIGSIFIRWDSKVTFDNKEWFRWSPQRESRKVNINLIKMDGYINQNKWDNIKKFLSNKSRINLANELVSNSMSLLFQYERRRSAVIEASTALEVALENFAKNPCLKNIKNSASFISPKK